MIFSLSNLIWAISVLSLSGHVFADVNTCVADTPYSGTALAFPLYDQWLEQTPTVGTSVCQNHAQFYANNNDKFAAIGYAYFDESTACGTCIEVTSVYGEKEILTVTDPLNTVNPGDIQLPLRVVQRLADGNVLVDNSVKVTWKFIECPNTVLKGADLLYSFNEGSRTDNMAQLKISNSIVGIRGVELKRGNAFIPLARQSGGVYGSMYFSLPQGVQELPYTVRVTSATYETVEFDITAIDTAEKDAGVRFTGACFPIPSKPPTPAPTPSVVDQHMKESGANTLFRTSTMTLSSLVVMMVVLHF